MEETINPKFHSSRPIPVLCECKMNPKKLKGPELMKQNHPLSDMLEAPDAENLFLNLKMMKFRKLTARGLRKS